MDRTGDLLQRASELVFQRAAFGIAHALGTPLNVISGHAELLSNEPDAQSQPGLRAIVAECRNITDVLKAPLATGLRASRGQVVALEKVIEAALELVIDPTRARLTIDAGRAAPIGLPEIDGILAIWTLVEIGARLSTEPLLVRAAPSGDGVILTLSCRTESESPKTARELAEPWRPGANPAIGHFGVLCHALAAVRGGGRPRVARDGPGLEVSVEISATSG